MKIDFGSVVIVLKRSLIEDLVVAIIKLAFDGHLMNLVMIMMMMMMMMMMILMIMNCFCDMTNQRKTFSLISSWDHCQRSSLSQSSDTGIQ